MTSHSSDSAAKHQRHPLAHRRFVTILTAVALGIVLGVFAGEAVEPLRIVGDGFIKLMQVTVLPYVLGSMLFGLGTRTLSEAKRLALRGGAVLLMFWGSALAVVAALSLAYPTRTVSNTFFADTPPPPPVDWLTLYIPSNPFSSLANNVMPAVVLFGLLAGGALCTMEGKRKQTLLDVLEAFNEAMGRIARATLAITPVGLFAIAAHAAGTMQPDQFLRLQLWFVVFIGSCCIVAFWMLPALVALVTPIGIRSFAERLRSPLLTAFAVGDLFIVLPLIAEECKALLREQGVAREESDATVGVVVPLLFNFPHIGKILSLGFLPFAAWFSGTSLSLGDWGTLASAGLLTLFGSLNSAIPFLLDLFHLPADLLGLFTMSSVLNSRFGALVAATHTAALALVIAAALLNRLDFQPRRFIRFAAGSMAILAVFIASTRLVFGYLMPPVPVGIEALDTFHLRPPLVDAQSLGRVQAPAVVPAVGRRLADITARGVIRVGHFTDSVPYAFHKASGELIGFDIEMAHKLAHDLGLAIQFVETTRADMAHALSSGTCDIVMSGVAVSVKRAEQMAITHTYQQERLGFLVRDEHRTQFGRLADVNQTPWTIGLPAIDDFAPLIRQSLPGVSFREFSSFGELVAAVGDGIDAAVLPIDRAFYFSRIDPRLSAVLPADPTSSVVLAYALPAGELELRNVVDAWIDVKRAQGAFDNARAYWVRGEGLVARRPRWSIGRDVLHWWR